MIYSRWFNRGEFACHCGCGYNTVDAGLLRVLEGVREYFGKAVKVTSGARCPARNEKVGGKSKSQHLLGRAADIQVKDTDPKVEQEHLLEMYPDTLGIGSYNSFTHVDTRIGKARW